VRRRSLLAAIGVAVALTAAACGGDDSSSDEPSDTTAAGLANPASEFCVEQGGTLEIVDEEGGQVGYCTLPDGTRVEEWAYFRENSPDAAADAGDGAADDGAVTEETSAP
jgi:hypothetical protein